MFYIKNIQTIKNICNYKLITILYIIYINVLYKKYTNYKNICNYKLIYILYIYKL